MPARASRKRASRNPVHARPRVDADGGHRLRRWPPCGLSGKDDVTGPGFVHLHVHSSYSLLEGAMTIGKLAELAKADRQPALALTDTDNMFGALEFSDKMAGYGIQPIIGCELAVDFGDVDPNARNALAAGPSRIVLLAARERGYRSLMRLNSRAFLEP